MTTPTPQRVELKSTSLAAATYDHAGRLRLDFHDGSRYDYFGVPVQTFHDLLRAPSKGKFFNTEIRKRFRYVKRVDEN
jgi:hypothetical protein